jgi:hypothetical protein
VCQRWSRALLSSRVAFVVSLSRCFCSHVVALSLLSNHVASLVGLLWSRLTRDVPSRAALRACPQASHVLFRIVVESRSVVASSRCYGVVSRGMLQFALHSQANTGYVFCGSKPMQLAGEACR